VASNLTPAQKQSVLKPLAYSMMRANLREIKQRDIQDIIKINLSEVSPLANCLDFVKEIENTSGLIVERENGEYNFSHLTFQEYLASVYILDNQLEGELVKNVDQSWWRETIRLYCAQTDASNIIQACLDAATRTSLGMAIECMREALKVNAHVREQYDALLIKGVISDDKQLRRLVSEARLRTRTGN
jgi:predicted NACHT family NTPase